MLHKTPKKGLSLHTGEGDLRSLGFSSIDEMQAAYTRHASSYFSDDPQMRHCSPLPRDAEVAVQDEIIRQSQNRPAVVNALIAAGMSRPNPNWFSEPIIEWNLVTLIGAPKLVMEMVDQFDNQRHDLTPVRMAQPFTVDGNSYGARTLAVSNRSGVSPSWNLITESVGDLTRQANRYVEYLVINGAEGFQAKGETFYGLLDAPNANTWTFVDSESWTAAGHTGVDILADVLAGMSTLRAVNKYGPFMLLVPSDYWEKLQEDYDTTSNTETIYDRLVRTRSDSGVELGPNLSILQADFLPDDTVIMLQMDSTTMELLIGQTPTMMTWLSPNGMVTNISVVSCILPQVKWDVALQSGIAIGTPS
jgi:hypothetical protein